MDLGSILILIGLTLLVVALIARPWRSAAPGWSPPRSTCSQALQAERDKILAMIRETEMDHAMGKIPDERLRDPARARWWRRVHPAARDRRQGGAPAGPAAAEI